MRDLSGNQLEILVERIEKALLPAGFTVTRRERVFDEETRKQIAEFDVVISGKLGSSSVRWLIQCRDRPSAGRIGAQWLYELVGYRDRFQFDKVFAVSTTGFTDDARRHAETERIILRTVERLTDVTADFHVLALQVTTRGEDWKTYIAQVPVVDVYSENGQVIGREGEFSLTIEDVETIIRILSVTGRDGAMQLKTYSAPPLPAGSAIELVIYNTGAR